MDYLRLFEGQDRNQLGNYLNAKSHTYSLGHEPVLGYNVLPVTNIQRPNNALFLCPLSTHPRFTLRSVYSIYSLIFIYTLAMKTHKSFHFIREYSARHLHTIYRLHLPAPTQLSTPNLASEMPPKKASNKAKPGKQNLTVSPPERPSSISITGAGAIISGTSGNGAAKKARRDDLAQRAEQRKLLHEMLALEDRGGLSAERAVALQTLFRNKKIPASQEAIQKDKLDRDNGLLEMSCARFRWLERQKMGEQGIQETTEPDDHVKKAPTNALGMPLETVDITHTPFVDMLKRQCEQGAAEEAAHRDIVRDHYKNRPFPKKSKEWECV